MADKNAIDLVKEWAKRKAVKPPVKPDPAQGKGGPGTPVAAPPSAKVGVPAKVPAESDLINPATPPAPLQTKSPAVAPPPGQDADRPMPKNPFAAFAAKSRKPPVKKPVPPMPMGQ